ncbi:MAG: MFS transporter, partial [Candidatus Accumulibacter sp.]|nr:MFS transporter [Accumulibacter sp.]
MKNSRSEAAPTTPPVTRAASAPNTVFRILGAISFSHFLNDTIQSLILASYPLFKTSLGLSFAQIGLITMVYQCTSALLQPIVGYYTDRRPKPFSLAVGMGCTLVGLLTLSLASHFFVILLAAALIGSGSAVFHPESSRVAR